MIVCGANYNSLRERLLCESELTLPKVISAGHGAEETRKHVCEILKSNETTICTRFQNTQNLEVKPPLKLQR